MLMTMNRDSSHNHLNQPANQIESINPISTMQQQINNIRLAMLKESTQTAVQGKIYSPIYQPDEMEKYCKKMVLQHFFQLC